MMIFNRFPKVTGNRIFLVDLDEDLVKYLGSNYDCDYRVINRYSLKLSLDRNETPENGVYILQIYKDETGIHNLISSIVRANPLARVLCTSNDTEIEIVVKAFRTGACDFVYHNVDIASVVPALGAIDCKLAHDISKAAHVASARARLESLSPRERMVLSGVFDGLQNKAIAEQLALSVRTVEMFRANMMQKLGVKTTVAAVRLAMEAGIN